MEENTTTIALTQSEIEIIKHALMLRESRMLSDADAYKEQNNPDAQKDCLDEWRKTHQLADRFYTLAQFLQIQ